MEDLNIFWIEGSFAYLTIEVVLEAVSSIQVVGFPHGGTLCYSYVTPKWRVFQLKRSTHSSLPRNYRPVLVSCLDGCWIPRADGIGIRQTCRGGPKCLSYCRRATRPYWLFDCQELASGERDSHHTLLSAWHCHPHNDNDKNSRTNKHFLIYCSP